MKKFISLLLALVMCVTLCVPAFATEKVSSADNSIYYTVQKDGYTVVFSSEPPPGMDNFVESNIMRGEEDDCGHYSPLGYRRVGRYNGNTTFDAFVSHAMLTLTGTVLSVLSGGSASAGFAISFTLGLPSALASNRIRGNYTTETYECRDPGIYPYIYWHHTWCRIDVKGDGKEVFVCEAVYEYALLP